MAGIDMVAVSLHFDDTQRLHNAGKIDTLRTAGNTGQTSSTGPDRWRIEHLFDAQLRQADDLAWQ